MLAIKITVVVAVATSVAVNGIVSGGRTLESTCRTLARRDGVDSRHAATQTLGVGQVLPLATLHVAATLLFPHPRRRDSGNAHRILVWWFEDPRRTWALGPSIRDRFYENPFYAVRVSRIVQDHRPLRLGTPRRSIAPHRASRRTRLRRRRRGYKELGRRVSGPEGNSVVELTVSMRPGARVNAQRSEVGGVASEMNCTAGCARADRTASQSRYGG